jgi:hypothetical protein
MNPAKISERNTADALGIVLPEAFKVIIISIP